jgi:hypothetical protein
MPPARFEPAIPASERPQTHALHRAPTGLHLFIYLFIYYVWFIQRRCQRLTLWACSIQYQRSAAAANLPEAGLYLLSPTCLERLK